MSKLPSLFSPSYFPLALLIILVIAITTGTSAQQAGDQDQTFGAPWGQVTTDFAGGFDAANSIVVQTDGKIIAAGSSGSDFALARYNTDGTLDNTFGTNGKVTTSVTVLGEVINSMLMQPDGKIIVAGSTYADFVLVRYNSDGTLDSSFGTDGIATTDFTGTPDVLNSIALQADGKIVAAGGSDINYALARYNSDGSLDVSFGTDGKVITNIGTKKLAHSVVIRPNGKILIGGRWQYGFDGSFSLAQFNEDGTIDDSFGTNGEVLTSLTSYADYGFSIILQPDGKIVQGGIAGNQFGLARFNENGATDSTFGNSGIQLTSMIDGEYADELRTVLLQPDGKIIGVGKSQDNDLGASFFAVARYNSNGSLDSSFGSDGKVISGFAIWDDAAFTGCLQADGKILAAGYELYGSLNFAVARYHTMCIQTTFYADADGDGFGNLIDTVHSCLMPPGYLTDSSDCNDANPNVYPGATEIPNNGIDDDCDGATDECSANFYVMGDTLIPHHYWLVNTSTGIQPFTYLWDWADGNYDSIANPSHIYEYPSAYDICLTIHDSTGCISSYCYGYDILKSSSENTILQIDVVDSLPSIATGVQNLQALQSWSVFPNPASGNTFVYYTLSTPATISMELNDVLGNKLQQLINEVKEAGEHNLPFDVGRLSNGIYVLQIRAGNQVVSQKIAVVN